jgi:hypothetical protein
MFHLVGQARRDEREGLACSDCFDATVGGGLNDDAATAAKNGFLGRWGSGDASVAV